MGGFLAVLLQKDLRFSEEHVEEMNDKLQSIHHRGQDKSNDFFHDEHIAFGSSGSHVEQQIYHFGNDRYTLMFNGTIYNTAELCNDLQKKGYHCETESANEVIATLFLDKGVDVFTELRGMYSIVIWDSEAKILYGARDCFGMKPLYYFENEDEIIFATEKKSAMFSSYEESVNLDAFQHYLTFQYVPEPLTLNEGIQKVEPGHYFIKEMNKPVRFKRYFHATFRPAYVDQQQLKSWIREALIDSVNVHMKSEKPLGAFLSGGIDSSIIVSLAKEVNPNIKTFSVGFENEGYSEVDLAKQTADELGVENISYTVTSSEYVKHLPKIMWHMDDPLADPACVPLYFATREARKHVDIVLSGEGADELFGGYNIYREPNSLRVFEFIPQNVNNALHKVATAFPEGMKGKGFIIRGTMPLKDRYIGNAKMFEEEEKRKLLKNYNDNITYQTITEKLYSQVKDEHPVHQMQYIDLHTWLPGDILLKAEKMSKANDMELRSPFLDKKVFDIARIIPVHEKVSNGTTKSILRESFAEFVPSEVLYRKKLGFPVPIKHWLKDDLFYWAKQLIEESDTDYLIHKQVVLRLLDRHAQGKGDYSRKIWTVLMFMLWHQIFIEGKYTFDEAVVAHKI